MRLTAVDAHTGTTILQDDEKALAEYRELLDVVDYETEEENERAVEQEQAILFVKAVGRVKKV